MSRDLRVKEGWKVKQFNILEIDDGGKLSSTPKRVTDSPTKFGGVIINAADACVLKVYDLSDTAVTLGVSKPLLSIPVAANGSVSLEIVQGIEVSNLTVLVTTTDDGTTTVTNLPTSVYVLWA